MLIYDEALQIVLRTIRPLPPVTVSLHEALGKVLAAPVSARWNMPPADNSAMDGFAFCSAAWKEGKNLSVTGFMPAGARPEGEVPAGEAVRIMTGAPLPAGTDTVVPFEDVEEGEGGITIRQAPRPGSHVRRRGEEFRGGEELLQPGTVLHAGEIGLLAAAGVERVKVHPFPRVGLLSTGDELVELGEVPGPGQIINSNFHLLAARLREDGCSVQALGVARDDENDLKTRIASGLEADMLVSTGGVSIGDRDLVQQVLESFGFDRKFWKVAIKPGKPVLFGTVDGKPVFGLPGNPAASGATFELFVRPALRALAGFRDPLPPRLRVPLAERVPGGEKRQRFLWGVLQEDAGRYSFSPSSRQSSGQNRSLQGSQALLPIPGNSPDLQPGQEVEVILVYLPPGPPVLL